MTDTVQTLVNKITDPTNPQWFIVVENADKTLNAVLKDNGVWRFISHESQSGTAYPDIMKNGSRRP